MTPWVFPLLAAVLVGAWTALLYGMGTLAFPYATACYAHQPAAVCGFAAFAALLKPGQGRAPTR